MVKRRQTEYASKVNHDRHSNSDRAPPDNQHQQTRRVQQEKRSHAEPVNFAGKRHVKAEISETNVRPHRPHDVVAIERKVDLTRGEGDESHLV